MRRGMRHAQLLGAREPLLHRLVPVLTREMGRAYPELLRAEALISETLQLEETRFRTTLARGLTLLDDAAKDLTAGQSLKGEVAFTLYDTYGFPLDLTQDALRARGVTVDTEGFDAAMQQQKAKARAAWAGTGEAATEKLWFPLRDKLGATEFLGYDTETAEGVITALIRDNAEVETLAAGESGLMIVNQTPFYGESGGQVGDAGTVRGAGFLAEVGDVQKKLGDVFAHAVTVKEGTLKRGAAVELTVDHARRTAIRANHSATHLLHEALRLVLGDHVAQKGSLVSPERLRFDFSHPKPISDGAARGRGDRQRHRAQERAGLDPADERRRGHRLRRPRPLRREIWRRGPRRLDGHECDRPRLLGRALRRHPCRPHRRYRPRQRRRRERGRSRRRRLEAMTGNGARLRLNTESRLLDGLASLLKVPAHEAGPRSPR